VRGGLTKTMANSFQQRLPYLHLIYSCEVSLP